MQEVVTRLTVVLLWTQENFNILTDRTLTFKQGQGSFHINVKAKTHPLHSSYVSARQMEELVQYYGGWDASLEIYLEVIAVSLNDSDFPAYVNIV